MRTARTHARRAVLATLAGFVLVQAALALVMWSDSRLVREVAWQRMLRSDRHRAEPGQLRVVQLGSSRTLNGFRPREAEPWLSSRLEQPVRLLNVGVPGSGPLGNRIHLQRLLNDGIVPDLLLLEVLPAMLAEAPVRHEITEMLPASHLRYDEACLVASLAPRDRPWVMGEWLEAEIVPASSRRSAILNHLTPRLLPVEQRWDETPGIEDAGWRRIAPSTPERAARAIQIAHREYAATLQTFRLCPAMLDAVADTLRLARARGVVVAVVLVPEGPTFRSWYPPGVWSQIHDAITTCAAAQEVPVVDLRELLAESDFIDSHHALPHGASKYTHELARRIEPMLRRIQAERSASDRTVIASTRGGS